MKTKITEEMKIHDEWYKEARDKDMSIEKLTELIRHLTEDYEHDYGTIVHACTAAAIAAVRVINNSDQGGITGFQAGAIMWEFIRHWNHGDNKCGMRLINFDNLLYPQHADQFEKTLTEGTWKALQEEAKTRLSAKPVVHPDAADAVVDHWKSIADGVVPFGFVVKED